mmetsp:Transcript_11513/g.23598  ORF Transcript_11513/g.23598 Transcript_11513/m.23598 type:complete len:807 (+) Transcript_11513:12-2432(+)
MSELPQLQQVQPSFDFAPVQQTPSHSSSQREKFERGLRRRQKLRDKVIDGKSDNKTIGRRRSVSSRTSSRNMNYSIPPGLLLLTFLLSISLLLFPSVLPRSSADFTKSKLYLKYSLRGFNDNGGIGKIVGLVLLCFTVVGVALNSLPRSVEKRFKKTSAASGGLLAYLPFVLLAIIVASVARFSLPAYIAQVRSFLSTSLRFCAPSPDRISAYVASHLESHGLSKIDSCSVADLVYLPVPWLENAHVPGSSFGGIHRGARANQIPYGNSRIADKTAMNWFLKDAPFYPTTFITEKDEVNILRAENRANSSYTWIVKAAEGEAKAFSKDTVGKSVCIGNRPYHGIAWLKGADKDEEKRFRSNAVLDERTRAEGGEERREEEMRKAMIRQQTGLSKIEKTERFLERLGEGRLKERLEDGKERAGDEEGKTERQQQHGHHLVQKYIDKPLLSSDGYKWNLRVPVLITAIEPTRVYAGKKATVAEFAKEKYGKGAGGEGWYSKDGKVEIYEWEDDGKWEEVTRTIFEVVFGSVESWKKDMEYSADLLNPAGSRPRGGGGRLGSKEAKIIEERYKKEIGAFRKDEGRSQVEKEDAPLRDISIEGEMRKISYGDEKGKNKHKGKKLESADLSDVDQSSIIGGGFHVFYFDFLFDEEEKLWLLDVDSFGGDEEEEEEDEEQFGRLLEDTFYLAGWTDDVEGEGENEQEGESSDYFERLLGGGRLEEAKEMQDKKSDVYICDTYSKNNKVGSGIMCNLRLRELRKEQRRMMGKDVIWKSVHPSLKTCGSLLKGRGEMSMLDAAQCSAVIADGLR